MSKNHIVTSPKATCLNPKLTEATLPQVMTEDELCAYLGKSKAWAQRARFDGSGPSYVKAGRKPLYPVHELEKWLMGTVRNSTWEEKSKRKGVVKHA